MTNKKPEAMKKVHKNV